ncbi:hypothetical protein AVEN_42644-1 [Araneus ventricosus]|uniref:Uncharacterized protein n=1 Tax=Araneus ventricosus TaxID=182803 RepID=A0A4Y2BM93_ARAVE|nr:hypothetical protein AVEN_42644-1 [Araneus ventricosus]
MDANNKFSFIGSVRSSLDVKFPQEKTTYEPFRTRRERAAMLSRDIKLQTTLRNRRAKRPHVELTTPETVKGTLKVPTLCQ